LKIQSAPLNIDGLNRLAWFSTLGREKRSHVPGIKLDRGEQLEIFLSLGSID
jgi:hypothetical protein